MTYKQQKFISQFWRLRSPRARGWQIQCLVKAHFVLHSFFFHWILTAERRSKFCCDSYKSTNRIHKGSNLMISSNPMYPSKSSPSNVILGSSVSMYEFGIWNSYEYEFSNWQSLTFGKIKGLKQGGILIFILSSCFGNPFSGPQPLGHGLVPVQSR